MTCLLRSARPVLEDANISAMVQDGDYLNRVVSVLEINRIWKLPDGRAPHAAAAKRENARVHGDAFHSISKRVEK